MPNLMCEGNAKCYVVMFERDLQGVYLSPERAVEYIRDWVHVAGGNIPDSAQLSQCADSVWEFWGYLIYEQSLRG